MRHNLKRSIGAAPAQLERLDYPDLSNNPLGLASEINQIPDIPALLPTNVGITELPPGLLKLTGGLEDVIKLAEMEVSTSEDSEPDE